LRRAVAGYLDHLTVERALAVNTLAAYRRDLDRYLVWLAAAAVTDLSGVGPRQVAAYLVRLREGDQTHPPLAPASAARAISAVRGLHRFVVREGLAPEDPSRDVAPPTPAKRLPKALAVDDVLRLLAASGAASTPGAAASDAAAPDAAAPAPAVATSAGLAASAVDAGGDPLALRDRALLEFLYGTGARISEAVGADRDDIDLAEASGEASALLRGKGGRTRLVPIGSYAAAALSAYLVRARPSLAAGGRGTPAVFLNARGGRLSRQSGWTILRRTAELAGLDATRVSPHTLRHSYATHLLDGGADVRVVQELLGHASVTTTQVYTLVTVEHLREVYALAHPRARG
jgi:integrase/recombinase XerD